MFQVADIYDEAKKIIGTCTEPTFFRWCTDAVALTANKGEFEAWKGWLDICTDGGTNLSLPREVETVIAVNLGGHPTLAKSQLFNFHLNGPGDCRQSCEWSWQDQGNAWSTYREIVEPSKLVAHISTPDDNNSSLIVHGFDSSGNRLRHSVSGEQRDGYQVPTIFGYALPDSNAPLVARITGVTKDETIGPVRLSTIDDTGETGTLLAVYEPDEKLPQYRRIKISRACKWVRIAYRRTNPVLTSRFDRIPLKSRLGFLLAIRALKYYAEPNIGEAQAFEANAARLEIEAQDAAEPPTYHPIMVVDLNNPQDKTDFHIS